QKFPCNALRSIQQCLRWNGLINDHRQITAHFREATDLVKTGDRSAGYQAEAQLKQVHRLIKVELLLHARVQLAKIAHQLVTPINSGCLTRMQGGMITAFKAERGSAAAKIEQRL